MLQSESVSLFVRKVHEDKLALLSITILGILAFCAIFADFLSPHVYYEVNLLESLKLPSIEYPLGTDQMGRDILIRLIHGARTVVYIMLLTTSLSASIGISLGLVSGYFSGIVDTLVQRATDILMSFPYVLLAIFIQSALGIGLNNAIIAIAIVQVASFAKLARGLILVEKQLLYIEGERALGAGDGRIIFMHMLPNIASPLLVQITLSMAYAILGVSALTFLGLGAQPPTVDWGLMVYEARLYMRTMPQMIVLPGLAIFSVTLALNVLGETLKDTLSRKD